jgi:L-alanine-DL-glutamate epimerase-like enolase superfamily enzyme
VRDHVRVYNGALRKPLTSFRPEDFAAEMARMMALPEGFTMVKQAIAFHSPMRHAVPDFHIGETARALPHHTWLDRGLMTERGMAHTLECVAAMKEVTGDKVGLALDCGPGFMLADAIRFAREVEKYNLLWLEDLLTGDYVPYVHADQYREVTMATTTPIHTGEQIYLRQNFKELIERKAVRVIGPDPCDVGGLAELKWIAEYADLHGVMIAPHGTGNGLLGLAALVQVCATLPGNFIAFELPTGDPPWWFDIVDQVPKVSNGLIEVPDRPGMGSAIVPQLAARYLSEDDRAFFD